MVKNSRQKYLKYTCVFIHFEEIIKQTDKSHIQSNTQKHLKNYRTIDCTNFEEWLIWLFLKKIFHEVK